MKQKGFTLVELIIAIMIMGILAGTMMLNPGHAKQNAQKEAEKIAALLKSAVQRADRMNISFDVIVNTDSIDIEWKSNPPQISHNPLEASAGCKYISKSNPAWLTYSKSAFPNSAEIITAKDNSAGYKHYITITGVGNSEYCVLLSGDN